jgi:hypothetical protein
MLRRVLVSILALAILGYGSAWAFAGPGFDLAEHSVAALHGAPADADHAGTHCDHRCHSSAHMVALHQRPPTLVPPGADRPVPAAGCPIASNPLAPLLRPPRS